MGNALVNKLGLHASTEPLTISEQELLYAHIAQKQREFVSACRAGDIVKMDQIIKEAREHNAQTLSAMVGTGDPEGHTELLCACRDGRAGVVERLLMAGANLETPAKTGATPLYIACQEGHLPVVERMLAAGASKEAATKNGVTPLQIACSNGHLAVVERMLLARAKIEAANKDGAAALYVASKKGHRQIVDRLLMADANTEAALNDGATPLCVAAANGHFEVVERLLAAGANIDVARNDGATPLHIASHHGHHAVVQRLLVGGANFEALTMLGVTPLHIACHNGHRVVVEKLLAAGANVDPPNLNGATPLFVACQNGHHTVVEKLLVAGANVDAPKNDGATPLFIAAQHDQQPVVRRLLAAGASVDTPKHDGVTPLHVASHVGNQPVVELLLAAGADPHRLCGTRKAIDFATRKNHRNVISLLSHPLPRSTAAAHLQRIQEIKEQLETNKKRYVSPRKPRSLRLFAPHFRAQQDANAAEVRRQAQQEDELAAATIADQTRLNLALAAAELTHFSVNRSQLEVDQLPFNHGANGSVHRGRFHGTAVAIKYLRSGVPDLYKREVRMWCKLRHPNVLPLLGLSLDPPQPMIVMELMERSLFDLLHDEDADLPWGRRVELAHGIAAGLSFIHSKEAVHRDIKSLNVLVKGWEVKIADFGATRGIVSAQQMPSKAGTPAYLAPELFNDLPPTPTVDVYAFGVVLFELASREIPWKGSTDVVIMKSVLAGDRPRFDMGIHKEPSGPEFIALMQKCWSQSEKERPTSAEALKELTAILGCTPDSISTILGASSSPAPLDFPPKSPPQPMYGLAFDIASPALLKSSSELSTFTTSSTSFTTSSTLRETVLPASGSTDIEWSMEEWMTSIGLSHHISTFRENDLRTPDLIKALSMQVLKDDLGISSVGLRLRIIQAATIL